MSQDKELFDRALGVDEPPLRLDFEAIENAGARSLRRRRAAVPLVTAAAAVVLIGGAVAVTGTGNSGGGSVQLAGPATQAASPGQSTPKAPAEISTAVPGTRTAAYCYRIADISSREPDPHVMVGVAGDDPDGRGDVASRLMNICSMAWRDNYYGWQAPLTNGEPDGKTYPVPELIACVLTDRAVDAMEGAAAVFPGTAQTCADMGLPVAALNGR